MNEHAEQVKNIIFDLGGVILNLDFNKTASAFTALGVNNFNEYFTQYHSHPLFRQLETGAIADASFYDNLRNTAAITASNPEIDAAWNAMLLDFPEDRIQRLRQLSGRYRIFLFSNTNAIHYNAFQQSFGEQYGYHFDSLFEKAWYSHLIGYRKPDIASFHYIINDGRLVADETLFIDDTLPNVEAARAAGLQAAHLPVQMGIGPLLDEILL